MTETPAHDDPYSLPNDLETDQAHLSPDEQHPDSLEANQLSPEEVRDRYAAWLARRDIDPADVPQITMDSPAYDLFRNAPQGYLGYARQCYGIPQDDQGNSQYALIEVVENGYSPTPVLIEITDVEFGTEIELATVESDFEQSPINPDDPNAPDRPSGALRTVDITEVLYDSADELDVFTERLMAKETADPFDRGYGDVGVRAGSLAPGQRDAFVWTNLPITKSIDLTVAFPSQYASFCIVRGEMRDPVNGKPGMAQIDNPVEVMRIDGAQLKELQRVYRELYAQPDFALTPEQKQRRAEIFNDHLISKISEAARKNRSSSGGQQHRRAPLMRERPLPR